ncbi:virB8 family protein [Pseudomonas aeruginosa]|uniref:virB8 family protein n=1 Tax=Pseudomonas aeruginosa TaxID=287 RepID=UPI000DFC64E3|nr:type IV secretion system protein [Pseudomonas aeruginosa]EKX5463460.1 type IV secretion system protein [Pseudomonas aeruginosa]SUG12413.1 conjugal transfer protein [Pseudomonas aeruginosa]
MLKGRSKQRFKALAEREQQLEAQPLVGEASREASLALKAYTDAARWFESSVAKQERSKARTWRAIAIVFGLLAFMAVGAVLGLTPLKTVEAFLVRVDNNTGFTDVVPVMKDRTGGGDEQDTQDEFWLATYVRFRESYSFAGSDVNYGMVRLLSYSGAFAEYRNFQLSSKGYTQVLGDNRQLRVEINNIVFLDADGSLPGSTKSSTKKFRTAQVRFTKTVLDRNGVPVLGMAPVTWLGTISFDYGNAPKTRKQRWLNPLGFGVAAYSVAQEVGGSQ